MTIQQVKAARVLLGWEQVTLALRSGVGISTIKRLEAPGHGALGGNANTRARIIVALQGAGAIFTESGGVDFRGK